MNRTAKIGGIIIVILAVAGLWGYATFTAYAPKEYVITTPTGSSTLNTTTGDVTHEIKKFSLADIATHKDTTSCYSAINGSVYDLTAWINLHPGGKSKILSICGTDGSEKFLSQHHGKPKFMNILSRFKIGTLS